MKISELLNEESSMPKTGRAYNSFARLHRAVQVKAARRDAAIEKKLNSWRMQIGHWNYALKTIGLLVAFEELVRWSYIAERMYATGEIESLEALQQYREFIWGQFVATTLAPWIVSKLKVTRIVMFIVSVIVRAMTLAGAIVTSPTGAGAVGGAAMLVAEQAFFTALQVFLQSPAATDFLATRLFKPLVFLGTVPEAIWNELAELVTGSNAYKDAIKKKAGTEPPDTQLPPSSAAVAQSNKYATANAAAQNYQEPAGSILHRDLY